MKLITVYLKIFLFATFGILPVMVYAGEKEIDGKPVRILSIEAIPVIFQDSIPVRRGSDKKEQDRPAADTRQGGNRPGDNRPGENRPEDIRRIEEINAENQRIRQKSGIKQVPRSIPKLKPKAVTDRIPIRRPPMRIPKKGFGGIHY
ncbi:MAG: hypothetical protein B7X86_04470 [Sphingobacteriales bacterium 17-39-43]|uniref:hypothetical protein n=1 Tax=Daejeonella sp. TaxID=2805397 RepID=UPI000BD8B623|nr:hypothetical protein [Daejeonella sp.]OYZ32588.1 MAG: hypothetical protein B7Y24_05295 [Sphingobacteriales bacterium 16-39-50]OYZ60346.1 MAG: hypothetical protein B7Y19_00330 [Sphingobacteriales bacterium 24-40-4]OZA25951.1 MAG: hypothetical protein B7X86_04470 [Sphingobacteriales bacterium 17-39-43]HQS04300.1 hypothetical protein [Daejeonella sp.]HQS51628.1 hypothetical protein [Daejeonella sp.]